MAIINPDQKSKQQQQNPRILGQYDDLANNGIFCQS